METVLITGVVLGLSAGLSPGPILTLVIVQTLKHGISEGIKVSLAPFVTDTPIIIVSLFVLSRMSNLKPVLGVITVFGGIYLFYLGYESIRFKGVELARQEVDPQSFKKGIMVNFLNPNPYLFWISIGGPLVIKASQRHTKYRGRNSVGRYVSAKSPVPFSLDAGGHRRHCVCGTGAKENSRLLCQESCGPEDIWWTKHSSAFEGEYGWSHTDHICCLHCHYPVNHRPDGQGAVHPKYCHAVRYGYAPL